METEIEREQLRVSPPGYPSRVVYEYDDDGYIISETELTDAQFAKAVRLYKAARKKWEKTGGVFYTDGVITERAQVRCADGSIARAIAAPNGKTGRWLEFRPG